MVAESPYRASDIKGGVAFPRRRLAEWRIAIFLVTLAQVGVAAYLKRGVAISLWPFVAVQIASLLLLARGRARPGLVLGLALMPAVGGEVCSLLQMAGSPILQFTNGSLLHHRIAAIRLDSYAATAVGCAVTATAAAGFLLSIDVTSKKKLSFLPLGWTLLCAAGFAVSRVHGTHPDALGGALGALPLVASGVFATFAAPKLAAIEDWHDEREKREARGAALVGGVSLLLCAVALERALLANDEVHALARLSQDTLGFEARLEHAQALAAAWCSHGNMIAMIAGAMLLPIVALVRSGAKKPTSDVFGAFGWVALSVLIAVLVTLRAHALVPNRVVATPKNVELPVAPALIPMHEPMSERVVVDSDGNFTPQNAATLKGDCTLVFAATTRSAIALRLASELPCAKWLLVEGSPPNMLTDVAFANVLAGPRLSALALRVHAPENDGKISLGWVIDETEIGRVRVNGGPVRGISFRRDAAGRELRHKLATEISLPDNIAVAPDPAGGIQALVDTLTAVQELAPKSVVFITDHDHARKVFER